MDPTGRGDRGHCQGHSSQVLREAPQQVLSGVLEDSAVVQQSPGVIRLEPVIMGHVSLCSF